PAAARHMPGPGERAAREPARAEDRVGLDPPEPLLAADRFPDLVRADGAADEAVEHRPDQHGVPERGVHVVVTAPLEAVADLLEREHAFTLELMQPSILNPLLFDPLDFVLERLEVVDERVVLGALRSRRALAQRREILLAQGRGDQRRALRREVVVAAREACALLDELVEPRLLLLDRAVGLGEACL